jgi:hypothetical protein
MSDSEEVWRANWIQSENLDREIGILRTLKSDLKPEFGSRREDRNDAVTGLSDDFVSPGNLFWEEEELTR